MAAAAKPLTVLVTGASGLIGSETCSVLAGRGHAVVALVHRTTRIVSSDGAALATRPLDGRLPAAGTITTCQGDVAQQDLGLGDVVADLVFAGLDRVVHCAAVTSLGADAASHEAINTAGTQNVLDMLKRWQPGAGLVHVSTAYVSGVRSGPIAEQPATGATTNSYERSKAAAERLAAKSGLAVAIARPSIVVGRWRDGAISRFENIYGLIRLVGEGRIRALPVAAGATLDLVPIDHVAAGLVDLVERFGEARGRVFHIASGDPVPVAAFCSIAFRGFHVPAVVPPELWRGERGGSRNELVALYAGYLARDPRFAVNNLTELTGRMPPSIGEAYLRRMVDHACAAGFLRPDPSLAVVPDGVT